MQSFADHMKEVHEKVRKQLEKFNASYKIRDALKNDCKHSERESWSMRILDGKGSQGEHIRN